MRHPARLRALTLAVVYALGVLTGSCIPDPRPGETVRAEIKLWDVFALSLERKLEAEPPEAEPIDEEAVAAKAEEAGL